MSITKRPALWSAVGGVLSNPVEYTIELALPVIEASVYSQEGVLVATVKQRSRLGKAVIDVSPYLKKLLSLKKEYDYTSIVSVDFNTSEGYYISFKDIDGIEQTDNVNIRYAVLAAKQEVNANYGAYVIANTAPVYDWDYPTIKCYQQPPRTTSLAVAKRIDNNPSSPTYGQHQSPGEYPGDYFGFDANSAGCPITNTAPDWQFYIPSLVCFEIAPRSSSLMVGKMRDDNPESPTHNAWRSPGTHTYNGDPNYFAFDNNSPSCPIEDNGVEPIWQFTGLPVCTMAVPRKSTSTSKRKWDANPQSSTFHQYLKADGSIVPLEADGDYFDTGILDPVLCKYQVDFEVDLYLSAADGGPFFGIPPATMAVDITYMRDGVSTLVVLNERGKIYVDVDTPMQIGAFTTNDSLIKFTHFFIKGELKTNPTFTYTPTGGNVFLGAYFQVQPQ